MLNAIGSFFGQLWRSANFWRISPLAEVRTGSKLAGSLMFLVMVFGIVGLVLMAFGFDLDRVDLWLDAQGGWLDAVGALAFRVLLGFILLICGVIILGWSFDRKNPDRPGWGMAIGALIVGYFCAMSVFAPL
ncbi:hypothetical protein ATE48_06500 [Candidatus Viadribacter manganicus]|uniref:Uncharacterized protein n=2 Tax=Candidatus Viadribacter manganicus TaxID=1759059 RepID=A0A1B1AG98_9PROT|nr:hypothetical protein ATE48_06500 [Candidatus Viadribacter manganicus]